MGKCPSWKIRIGPLTRVNADDFPAKVAAEVKDFDPRSIYG